MRNHDFTREVMHRATLLTDSFNPGRAVRWARKTDNCRRIQYLQEETLNYLSGDFTPQEVRTFWRRLETSPELKEFIRCLGPGARMLCLRGMRGDVYSIAVLHCAVCHFMRHYLLPEKTIVSGSNRTVVTCAVIPF